MSTLVLALGAALWFPGCASRSTVSVPEDWTKWRAKRHQSIGGTNGWSTLVGLHWLDEGRNSVGADATNRVVLPAGRAAGAVGVFVRDGRMVRFVANPLADVTVAGARVGEIEMVTDVAEEPTVLAVGPLKLTVIARGEQRERLGVRVRDPEAPARRRFSGLPCFPYDPRWRVVGRFERFTEPRPLRVPDVTGNVQVMESPGAVVFAVEGREFRLDAALEPGDDRLFIIFRDRTNGRSTYGAGRFLYAEPPGAGGAVELDFNRAYSPPCAFTPFATCPLPPPQNRLPFEVRAGERKPPGAHP